MSKYLRTRHVPLDESEPKAVKEEVQEFIEETKEAGELLKYYRETEGLSASELGGEVGVAAELIHQMEKGEQPITFDEAKKFGELFSVDYHVFL